MHNGMPIGVNKFRTVLVGTFDKCCDPFLYAMKYHLLDYIMRDI